MNIPFSNKDTVKRSPLYLSNNLLNKLEKCVQNIDNVFVFKKCILKIDMSELDLDS